MAENFPTPKTVWDYISDLSMRVQRLEKEASKK